jgi:hypothetical protein
LSRLCPYPPATIKSRILFFYELEELGGNRPACLSPHLVCHDHSVTHQIRADVGQGLLGLRLRFVLADFDEQNLLGFLQQKGARRARLDGIHAYPSTPR